MSQMLTDLKAEVGAESTFMQIKAIVDRHAYKDAHKGPLPNYSEVKQIFKSDSATEIVRRIQESKSDFAVGLQKVVSGLSPLGMCIVYESLVRARTLTTIKEAFDFEYGICAAFMQGTEFFEGVRALLVDKDRQPKWGHSSVAQVTKEEIEEFF